MILTPCICCHRTPTETETGWARTCPRCTGRTRRDLIAVESGYALLGAEMLARVGAATPPDPTGRHADNQPMPGGDILVMLGPGSTGWHTDLVDVDSILGALERWDTDWRITFADRAAADPATMSRVCVYLLRRMGKAADEHPAFHEFAADVARMRGWVQAALRDGPQHSAVPCTGCGRRMLAPRQPNGNGKAVEWGCENCHQTYTWSQYYIAARDAQAAV